MLAADDEFLTTEQVLAYLRLNLKTVYRLINAGKLPAIRVGHQWRFRKRDLDSWLASNTTNVVRPPAAAGSASLLVVDDDESTRDFIVTALERSQRYETQAADSGESALALLRSRRFDGLLVDLRMPGMDGLTLVREARKIAPDIAVVIITGASSEASAIEAIRLGVAGYVLKPFNVADMIETVERALGRPSPSQPAKAYE